MVRMVMPPLDWPPPPLKPGDDPMARKRYKKKAEREAGLSAEVDRYKSVRPALSTSTVGVETPLTPRTLIRKMPITLRSSPKLRPSITGGDGPVIDEIKMTKLDDDVPFGKVYKLKKKPKKKCVKVAGYTTKKGRVIKPYGKPKGCLKR